MNYLHLMDDRRPPAPSNAIRALEQHIGAPLPAPYKELLAQSDGGGFDRCGVELPWRNDRTVLDVLFTTHPTDSYGVIDNYDVYRGMNRIPRLSCPFAPDPGGDLFLLSLEEGSSTTHASEGPSAERISAATDDEIFDLIDNELGIA